MTAMPGGRLKTVMMTGVQALIMMTTGAGMTMLMTGVEPMMMMRTGAGVKAMTAGVGMMTTTTGVAMMMMMTIAMTKLFAFPAPYLQWKSGVAPEQQTNCN